MDCRSEAPLSNPVIEAIMRRRSIRRYTEEVPADRAIEAIVRAGQ